MPEGNSFVNSTLNHLVVDGKTEIRNRNSYTMTISQLWLKSSVILFYFCCHLLLSSFMQFCDHCSAKVILTGKLIPGIDHVCFQHVQKLFSELCSYVSINEIGNRVRQSLMFCHIKVGPPIKIGQTNFGKNTC